MRTASVFGFRHAPQFLALLGLIALVSCAAVLLASVVLLLAGVSAVPTLEDPLLGPFRWDSMA